MTAAWLKHLLSLGQIYLQRCQFQHVTANASRLQMHLHRHASAPTGICTYNQLSGMSYSDVLPFSMLFRILGSPICK